MINRFSHIVRSSIIVLLLAGFAAHLAIPFFGDVQKNAFTQWLDHKVVAGGDDLNDELRDRIRKLPKEAANFWILVQDASKLISEHENEFQITPFSSANESDQVFTWLIGQWSTFKHQQNNANAVLPEILPPIQKWITQLSSLQSAPPAQKSEITLQFSGTFLSTLPLIAVILSPPASGISINAP